MVGVKQDTREVKFEGRNARNFKEDDAKGLETLNGKRRKKNRENLRSYSAIYLIKLRYYKLPQGLRPASG